MEQKRATYPPQELQAMFILRTLPVNYASLLFSPFYANTENSTIPQILDSDKQQQNKDLENLANFHTYLLI